VEPAVGNASVTPDVTSLSVVWLLSNDDDVDVGNGGLPVTNLVNNVLNVGVFGFVVVVVDVVVVVCVVVVCVVVVGVVVVVVVVVGVVVVVVVEKSPGVVSGTFVVVDGETVGKLLKGRATDGKDDGSGRTDVDEAVHSARLIINYTRTNIKI